MSAAAPRGDSSLEKARGRDLGFIARAVSLMAVLYGLYYYPYAADGLAHAAIDAFLRAQATGSAALIRLFDVSASASGTTIFGRFPLEIVRSCSSLDAQALYAATVLAFPARLPSKLLGLVAGFAAITLLNMARIASLYFIGAHAPSAFEAAHEELFPLALIAVACACFAAWAHWAARERRAEHVAV